MKLARQSGADDPLRMKRSSTVPFNTDPNDVEQSQFMSRAKAGRRKQQIFRCFFLILHHKS
jgi:hypothetical protein